MALARGEHERAAESLVKKCCCGAEIPERRKYCSRKCMYADRVGKKRGPYKVVKANAGWYPKGVSQHVGADNPNWQGDEVSYKGLHLWVNRNKVKPSACAHCNRMNRRLEWASKSREYKRDLDDWLALCRSCHLKYDKHDRNAASKKYGAPGPNGH